MTPSDTDAQFVGLLTEHQAAIRLYVASLLPGDPGVPDVTQEANTTIWKKRDDFELGTNFKAWVFSIARYEVLKYRKRQIRDGRCVFTAEMENIFAQELPEHPNDLEERQLALRRYLQKLKPTDRDLSQHRYYEGAPLKQYADQMGLSLGGLKVTLHRIRTRLQRCVMSQLASETEAGQ